MSRGQARTRVRVPATTANLGPGFDCLGMALQLYNEVEVELTDGCGLIIEVSGAAAAPDIPRNKTNLAYRAAARVFELAGRPMQGMTLRLKIEAPLARGLGSSASAIVGGMAAANAALGNPLTPEKLLDAMAEMEGHPDNVVPCFAGGLTASLMAGKHVIFEKAEPAPNVTCVLFIPDYPLETAKARAAIPAQVPHKDAVFNSSRVLHVFKRLENGRLDDLQELMDDRLHQPCRIPLIRGYEKLKEAALAAGAAGVCISGAGPTVLAVCEEDTASLVAAAGTEAFRKERVAGETIIVNPDHKGCLTI